MKVSEYIKGALLEMNAIAPGETVPDELNQLGLAMFNEMVDQWKGIRATVFKVLRSVYYFTANKASYQIGNSAVAPDWVGYRPQDIERAGFINTVVSNAPTETPMRIYTDEEYACITLKNLTNQIVEGIWYQKSFPLGTIFPWPICSSGIMQIALYVPTPIDEVSSDANGLNTDISVPPAGRKAIRLNLALAMAPGLEIPATSDLVGRAALALDNYEKSFYAPSKLAMPAGIRAQHRRRGYNIITNEGGY